MKKLIIRFILTFSVVVDVEAANLCERPSVTKMDVSIDITHVLRRDVPTDLFGFNIPWYAFQAGLQVSGEPKPELVEWLMPFQGALYRYPGGTPSNWFEWENSIKPMVDRKPMHYEFGKYYVPEFGYDEFLKFVQKVNGHVIITMNLVGPYTKVSSPTEVADDASRFVDWLLNKSSVHCIGSDSCPIEYLELGNELDWTPYLWSSKIYSDRANGVIKAVGVKVPEKVWVANGKTAPWGATKGEGSDQFNGSVAKKISTNVQNIAYHPYYDGISIPDTTKYLGAYHSVWSEGRKSANVIVTEHARWPSMPSFGKWNDRWFEATGQGGAISSSDFILALLPDKRASGAIWHALGVLGPWQLIRWDKADNTLYPSPVYWGLRTLREGFLDDVVEITPNFLKSYRYSGGYEVRLVAMKGKGKVSLLGVNRSGQPLTLNVKWLGSTSKKQDATMRFTSALNQDDNDDLHKDKVVMQTKLLSRAIDKSQSNLCIPANSIFSLVF